MHAHLRWAQALAHFGDAERFFHALAPGQSDRPARASCRTRALRQANCYYSSSDAAFADRYQARPTTSAVRSARSRSTAAGASTRAAPASLFGSCRRATCSACACEADVAAASTRCCRRRSTGCASRSSCCGQRFEIRYRVRGAGCGVDALQLDGRALAFGEEPNPYRRGAARVALSDLAAGPDAGARPRRLEIGVGIAVVSGSSERGS